VAGLLSAGFPPALLFFAQATPLVWLWPLLGGLLALVLIGLALCWLQPALALRLGLALLSRSLYWLRCHSRNHVPHRGGALLVCHSLHGLDCLWLFAAAPRYVQLGLCTGLPQTNWLARWLLRWSGAILLDGNARAEDLDRFVKSLREALDRGELVGLLAETNQTAGGVSLLLGPLLEALTRDRPVPIVPVCVDQVWGTPFRWVVNRLTWHWPQQAPYRVDVSFGRPLEKASSGEVCRAIQHLSAGAGVARNQSRPLVHRHFVRMAARHPFRSCVIDSTMKTELSYGRTLAGAICLKRALKPLLGDDAIIGSWLPPSIGGVLTNLALCFLGKVAVNLNYTAGPAGIQSALRQCNSKHVITSKRFTDRVPLDAGPDVKVIYLEDILKTVTGRQKLLAFLSVVLLPGWVLEHWFLGLGQHQESDLATIIFSSGSTGDPKGVM
jgi:acyl-[acyl-carrier-protein]-phospholipid O-acyltransferase/long-chain-fatty-acid--[acyl-carrier-protein] ligase